jgi:hypothetical protein
MLADVLPGVHGVNERMNTKSLGFDPVPMWCGYQSPFLDLDIVSKKLQGSE